MARLASLFSTVLTLAFAIEMASAQETRGTILGRITDPSGAVIPNVTVRVTNLATNVTFTTRSNNEGIYEIPYLLPGSYRLVAEMPGFRSFVRENIELRIADRVTIPIQMQVGEVSEQVTVVEQTPLLEAATASMGQVIDQRRIAELPIAHGNPFLLISLSPGVVHTQNPGLDRPFEPTHIVGYSMDGVRANRSEVTLDGTPNTALNNRWGVGDLMAGYTPPADMVQEFKVQTFVLDASVGHTQGGVTSITLKSGGNQLHGTGYFSLLDPALNANLFFANRAGQPKGDFTYRRWGAHGTGPVIFPRLYDGRDRTFFAYGYEGIRESRAVGSAYGEGTLTVPTPEQKRGDFSALLRLGSQYQIYDPFTRVPAPGGRTRVDPLPGNIIPPSRIHPVAQKILSYWSDPNVPGTADGRNNLIRVNDPEVIRYYNHVIRVDHNFSSRHRMFARFNTYNRYSWMRDWFRNIATGGYSDWKQHAASLDDVYEIGPTTIFNVRYGFYRLSIHQFPKPESMGFDLTSLGFPKSYADAIPADVRVFPSISIDGYTGTQNNWWRYPHQNQSIEVHLTAIRSSHAIRFGGSGRQYRTFQYEPHHASTGIFSFGTTWTRGPFDNSPASPIGQGLASLLFGLPTSGGVDRKASFAEQSTMWGLYIQDDWKLTSKLTLNLGLRYEIEGPMTERFNRTVRGYDFRTASPLEPQVKANYARNPIEEIPPAQFRLVGGLTFPGIGGQPRTLWKRDKNNFMPRIGFAWALDSKTVVRGGFGMYFAPLGIHRGDVGPRQYGFSLRTELIPSLDNGLTFRATLSDPFPDGIQEPRGAADGLLTFVGRSVSFFDETPRAGYQQRWQFGIQRELPQRVLIELAYVGNHGAALEVTRDYRYLPVKYLSRSPFRDQPVIDYLSAQVPNPFYPLLPGTGLAGATVSRAYLLSSHDYAHFTGLSTTMYEGYSWYHSLQVRTERRFAAGWTLNAAYQWSKNMEALSRLNGMESPLEYVISDQDRPHRFVVSGIWELPVGRGRRWLGDSGALVNALLGGWQIQGIYTAQGGAPLSWGNVLFIGNIKDITLPKNQRTPEMWFNINAGFERNSARQLSYNYRTFPSRLNDVRSDGFNIWDLSVLKNTRLREGMNLQIRGEFLNAFNHPMFGAPTTSPTSTAFGQVTSQRGYPRRIQLGAKLLF
ncbi:MAG: TonB-dependent receptor [Bryobacterales bacterium]|nr:TonB-dependent receptor [Bryobacterales bacterium]